MSIRQHAQTLMASALSLSMAFSPLALDTAFAQSNSDATTANQADANWEKEFTLWRAASKTGLLADYQAYLKSYPKGKFAKVAKSRIDTLIAAADKPKTDTATTETATTADPAAADTQTADTQTADTGVATVEKQAPDATETAMTEPTPQGSATGDATADETATNDTATDDMQAADDTQAADETQTADNAQADDAGTTKADDQNMAATEEKPAVQAADAGGWEQEYALWKAAAQGNTVPEYEAYLKTYPTGKFAAIAQTRIVALAAAEQPVANVAEGDTNSDATDVQAQDDTQTTDDLNAKIGQQVAQEPQEGDQVDNGGANTQVAANNQRQDFSEGDQYTEERALDYEGRVDIQGRLSSLGYDLGAVDGAFGQRTRNAIAQWQEANGAPVTGYLSDDQIDALREQTDESYRKWLAENEEYSQPVIVQPGRVVVERPVIVERIRPRVVLRPHIVTVRPRVVFRPHVVRPRIIVRPRVVIGRTCFINRHGRRVCRR